MNSYSVLKIALFFVIVLKGFSRQHPIKTPHRGSRFKIESCWGFFFDNGVEICSPKSFFQKSCVRVSFCKGLCHGNVSMVTLQRRQYGSVLLSWENLGSFCLVGNDDNSAECWLKLEWRRLPPSYCRERR